MLTLDMGVFDDDQILVDAIADFIRRNSLREVERLATYCSANGNDELKIREYIEDAKSMLKF